MRTCDMPMRRFTLATPFAVAVLIAAFATSARSDSQQTAPYLQSLRGWLDANGKSVFQSLDWNESPPRGLIRKYRLYVPPMASADHKLPLLVWLNGDDEGGTDNEKHLLYLDHLFFHESLGAPEFFILAVQTPDGTWPAEPTPQNDDAVSITRDILEHVIATHPVDGDRVVVSGPSSGGDGAWNFAARYPDRFAAILPLASHGCNPSQADKYKDIAVWAFHSINDKKPPYEQVWGSIDAVLDSGGRAWLTLTGPNEKWPHDCWHEAYEKHNATAWMLSQRRRKTTSLDRWSAWASAIPRRSLKLARTDYAGWPLYRWGSIWLLLGLVGFRMHYRHRHANKKSAARLSQRGDAPTLEGGIP